MRSGKKWMIAAAAAAAVLCGVLLGFNWDSGAPDWQEQYDLGVRYLSEGRYEEAVLAFDAAISLDPQNPDAYLGRAEANIALENYEDARKDLAEASSLAPENITLKDKVGKLEEAILPTIAPDTAQEEPQTQPAETEAPEPETEPETVPETTESSTPAHSPQTGVESEEVLPPIDVGSPPVGQPSHSDLNVETNTGDGSIDYEFPDEDSGTSHNPMPDIEPDNSSTETDTGSAPDVGSPPVGEPSHNDTNVETNTGGGSIDYEFPSEDSGTSHNPMPEIQPDNTSTGTDTGSAPDVGSPPVGEPSHSDTNVETNTGGGAIDYEFPAESSTSHNPQSGAEE